MMHLIHRRYDLVKLRRDGYDPFVDYIKGICIAFVILNHSIPYKIQHILFFPLWGSQAVPIFLIIQVFHSYKKGLGNVKVKYWKLWHRIIKPFLIVELFAIILNLCFRLSTDSFDGLNNLLIRLVKAGGRGSGSYYPWIYLQFAIILPVIVPIFKRYNGIYLAFFFIVLSELLEITCCIINMPEFIYRILFLRYAMLIYLGYILATRGFVLNKKTLLLALLSASFVLFFEYRPVNLSPFIYYTPHWQSYHWMCYYYIPFVLVMLNYLYDLGGGIYNQDGTLLI